MKTKAIIFDIGGVLRGGKKHIKNKKGLKVSGVHEYVSGKLGLSIDAWFDSIDSVYTDSMEGKINSEKTVKLISGNLNISPAKLDRLFYKAYKKKMKKNKKLYRFALKSKKRGYIIGILSDQWALSKENIVPKSEIKDFDVAVLSCDVGLRKPDVRIYKLLMKKLRQKYKTIKYNEVLFIDNRDWNLKPAKKLGMKTILFKDNKQFFKDIKKYL